MTKKVPPLVFVASLILFTQDAYAFSWASVLEFFSTLKDEGTAWAIEVKQTALAANQEAQSYATSNQQLATAIGAINLSERMASNAISFDMYTGQPDSIKCIAQKYGKLHVEAISQADKDAKKLLAYYASERVLSSKKANDRSLAIHKEAYCTISEAKQRMCNLTPNGMQGWDANYGGAFTEQTLAPEGELAAYNYVAMLTDRRSESVADCASAACQSARSKQLAASAMATMAANSLINQATSRRVPMLTGK